MVLQNSLPTVFATNEAYAYRAPGLKAFNDLKEKPGLKEIKYATLIARADDDKKRFDCKMEIRTRETNTSAEYEKELCDEVSELFSAAVSLEYLYEKEVVYSEDRNRPFYERVNCESGSFDRVADLIALTGYEAMRLAL